MTATPAEAASRAQLLLAEAQRRSQYRFRTFFPTTGPLGRDHYRQHMAFFGAGATHKERLFMAANRVGKSESGAYETTCHLTGLYPEWWTGRRFETPVDMWACGTTAETTRDIVQQKLLGAPTALGSGMLPAHLIVRVTKRQGRPDAVETIYVRHVTGGLSSVSLKSYEQGRESFEGTARHGIWCDEEPPMDCYIEMLFRTATTRGIVYTTFTPLKGRSEVVTSFLEADEAARAVKHVTQAGWDDVPHLSAEEQTALRASTPPYLLAARTKGEPLLGAGAVYPIGESDIVVPTFDVPDSWRRVYGMDVGWNRTAVVWGAEDPASGVITLYSEHYQGQGEPATHADAVRSRGAWVPGVIDPACLGSSQIDGRQLMDVYRRLGLDLEPATNTVEAGITEVWQLLVGGRLKVMAHLTSWLREFRNYHRDDKGSGKIVKRDDHLMDATRYLVVSGRARLRREPAKTSTSRTSAGVRNWGWS